MMTRPIRSSLALLLVLGLVAAACGGDDAEPEPAAPTTTAAAAPETTAAPVEEPEEEMTETTAAPVEEPEEEMTETTAAATTTTVAAMEEMAMGGSLRMVIGAEPSTLNPMTGTRSDQVVAISIIERLVVTDANVVPSTNGLVDGWERVDDLTWRFSMREGVTFSNGEPAGADAAAFSLITHRDTDGSVLKGFFQVFADVVVVDDTTFEVTTTIPTNAVPELLANLYVFPPAYYAEVGHEGYGLAPIGTGPFVLSEWNAGSSIVATRNPDHWRGQSSLDQIQWTWAGDDATRVALLQTGEADLVVNVPTQLQDDVAGQEGLTVHPVAALSNMTIFLVATAPPFDDVRVRTAAAKAIDRQLLVDAIFDSTGASANSNYFHTFFQSVDGDEEAIGYDPDGAAALLAEVGGEISITNTYTTGRYPSDSDVGEAISGMLEAVGFSVTRNPLDVGTFFGQVIGGELDGMFMFATVPVYPHEDVLVRAFMTSNAITKTCPDDRIDPLADQGLAATDAADRNATYDELGRIGIVDLVCWIPLYEQVLSYGYTDSVHGFVPARDDLHDYFMISMG